MRNSKTITIPTETQKTTTKTTSLIMLVQLHELIIKLNP
jgi:hypothetical protein